MPSAGAGWSNISLELLSCNFEAQNNALHNCAAACTCVRCRTAVADSHIRRLHLHADSVFYNSNWRSFFKARKSIGHLHLTSDVRRCPEAWAAQLAQSDEQGSCLKHIPPGCSVLSVSQDFLLPGSISHLVGLQHLTLTWNANTYAPHTFLDLAFLEQLKRLELH